MSEPEGKEEAGNTILAYTTRGLIESVILRTSFSLLEKRVTSMEREKPRLNPTVPVN